MFFDIHRRATRSGGGAKYGFCQREGTSKHTFLRNEPDLYLIGNRCIHRFCKVLCSVIGDEGIRFVWKTNWITRPLTDVFDVISMSCGDSSACQRHMYHERRRVRGRGLQRPCARTPAECAGDSACYTLDFGDDGKRGTCPTVLGRFGPERFGLQSEGGNSRRYDALKATGCGCGLDFWAKTT